MSDLYIGLDIGGTKCAAVLGTKDGAILRRIAFPSGKDMAPEHILNQFYSAMDELLEASVGHSALTAIGVSCGGPLDTRRGLIQCPPNLPLWDDVPICELLFARYKCPAFLQNDANACAVAEWKFGAGKGTRNMVFLTFGTGLGAGLILNERLYDGANGMAGEIGHMRLSPDGPEGYGKRGSFEGFCSGAGIAQLGRSMLARKFASGLSVDFCRTAEAAATVTAKDICIAAENGDAAALEIITTSAKYLGRGLSIIIDFLNPERIVIGSIFARSEKLFRGTMQRLINEEALAKSAAACRVVPALLGEKIGDVAALTVASYGGA